MTHKVTQWETMWACLPETNITDKALIMYGHSSHYSLNITVMDLI